MRDYANVEIIPYSREPEVTWKRIAECDVFFGVRLHSGIFAFIADVPFVLVEYHLKCKDFLDDINWPERWRIGDFYKTPDDTAEILLNMLHNRSSSLPINKEFFIQKAERNFTSVYQ